MIILAGKIKDLTGQIFGKLTVIKFAYVKNRVSYWHCKCNCGNEIITSSKNLTSGHKKSCGCLQKENMKNIKAKYNSSNKKPRKDLTGLHIGCLEVLPYAGNSKWNCICHNDNNYCVVSTEHLTGKKPYKSCGCLKGVNNNFVGEDITGNIYNNLKVIGYDKDIKKWKYICMDCGTEHEDYRHRLIHNKCSCKNCRTPNNFIDLVGQKFGELTVVAYDKNRHQWKCKCSCGNITYIKTSLLKGTPNKKPIYSCGCLDISHRGSSGELEVLDFIKSIVPDNYVIEQHNRTMLDGKEIDIYIHT